MKKIEIISMDLETTTVVRQEGESFEDYHDRIKMFEPEMYAWGASKRKKDIVGIKDYNKDNYVLQTGTEWDSFFDFLFSLNKDVALYFHNGGKFDLHFVLPQLIKNGLKQLVFTPKNLADDNDFDFDKKYETLTIEDKVRPLKFGEYSLLVDENHKIMEMKIAIPSKKKNSDKNRVVCIRDSNLMFANSLKGYGVSLNKHYNTWTEFDSEGKPILGDFSKLELKGGYKKVKKYKNYKEFELDGNEKSYLEQDCIVLLEFLHMMCGVIPFNKWKITAASTAYNLWKYEFIGADLLAKEIKHKRILKVKPKNSKEDDDFWMYRVKGSKKVFTSTKIIDKVFDKYFPVNWMSNFTLSGWMSDYKYIHGFYNGGMTMANPDLAGKVIEDCAYVDVNSHYSSQMVSKKFPYGLPIYEEIISENHLNLYELDIKEAINEKGLPFLFDFHTGDSGKHYPFKIKNKVYQVTDEELKRFKQYYKGKFNVSHVVCFEAVEGDLIFGRYIKKFYDLKSAEGVSEAERLSAKLFLNALYGKFGQDIERVSRILTSEGWESVITISEPRFYLPIAVWITAHARMFMVDAIGEYFSFVVYTDTDSFIIKIPSNIDLENRKNLINYIETTYNININEDLCGWDIDKIISAVLARRAKQYITMSTSGIKDLKMAGLRVPYDEVQKMTFADFAFGKEEFKQLRPHRLPTGICLEEYEKRIPPIWEYKLNTSNWFQNEEEYRNEITTKELQKF